MITVKTKKGPPSTNPRDLNNGDTFRFIDSSGVGGLR